MPPEESRKLPVALRVGDRLGDSDYVVVDPDGSMLRRGEQVESLGHGGASIVVRAFYKDTMTRAVKLLAPREDLLEGVDPQVFEASFEREVSLLSGITHTRISKITDQGSLVIDGERFLFYAMDLVEGGKFDSVLDDEDFDAAAFLSVLDQLLGALEHLHDGHQVLHCDVKEGNVLVKKLPDGFELTLVDLGVAKTLKPPLAEEEQKLQGMNLPPEVVEKLRDFTVFNSTPRIVRPEWQEWVFHEIPYSQLERMLPSHDLYGVGLLIRLAVDHPALSQRLAAELGSDGMAAMHTIMDRLLAPAGSEYYQRTRDVRSDWAKLDPGYLAPLKVPELALGGAGMTSLSTPGGQVLVPQRTMAVFDHPLVQRLRHIPQLELAALLYPGATHTRLLHSVATFEAAKRFVLSLLGDPRFRLMAERSDIEAALLSALLHDVGHYPLSHMFEDFAEEERRLGRPGGIPTDDDLFWAFVDPASLEGPLAEYPREIERALKDSGADPSTTLHEAIIGAARISPSVVQSMHWIDERRNPCHCILAAMLSSPIDVDKIAYLQDDSRMTGLGYGAAIDLDALLPALRAPLDEHVESRRALIGLADKGLPAAEAIVLARYWMLRRVYWHPANRAIIAMVKFVIAQLRGHAALDMPEYVGRHLFATADHALRYLSGAFADIAETVAEDEGRPVQNPIPGLLGGNRRVYKVMLAVTYGPDETQKQLHAALSEKRPAEIRELMRDAHAALADVADGYEIRFGDVIVDIPLKQRDRPGFEKVLVYDPRWRGERRELNAASPLLNSLEEEFLLHVKVSRIFIHPHLAEFLRDNEREKHAREALREVLLRRSGLI